MKTPSAAGFKFRFRRAKPEGLIQVLNENSYVMAEYNENSGVVRWHRVLVATQKTAVEQCLFQQYQRKPDADK